MKIDIYPYKAQYLTDEAVKIVVEKDDCKDITGILKVMHLEKNVLKKEIVLTDKITEVELGSFAEEFAGYGVVFQTAEYIASTSFDVVKDPSYSIRYGFLSDFGSEDKEEEDVANLRKYHINMVQYYDWSYRHDQLVGEENQYADMMGRKVDLETVRTKIAACKKYGMKSIGYGAIYAASKEFYENHKDWGLLDSSGKQLCFIDIFYIMNVARGCGWKEHIIKEYAKAVKQVGFDGIHMDTYGFPKTAFSYEKEHYIHMDEEYPYLINDTKEELNKITKDNYLIFNNVGNWPVTTVARADQQAVYIEVWNPYDTYQHIKQVITDAKRACDNKKPVILAAYLAPFRLEEESRASVAAFLLTAVITVNGAYHLLLGEKNGVLTQGYYVDHSHISQETAGKLRKYYDFIVRYLEVFYDSGLKDVSMTHMGWDNTEYKCSHCDYSVDGQADKVWLTIREDDNRKLISLINLCGNREVNWNQGKNMPVVQENIELTIQTDKEVKGVYCFSPDEKEGLMEEIAYKTIETDRGMAVLVTVPKLYFWSNIYLTF